MDLISESFFQRGNKTLILPELTGPSGDKRFSKRKYVPATTGLSYTYMASELSEVVQKYRLAKTSRGKEILKEIIKSTIDDVEADLCSVLMGRYNFTHQEAQGYVRPMLMKKAFVKSLRAKVLDTKALDTVKADVRYYELILPLFQTFRRYLPRKAEYLLFWYMAHLLVSYKIEKGTPKQAYNAIQTFRKRYESLVPASRMTRKDPPGDIQ